MLRPRLHEQLNNHFGFSEFREGQKEIIEDVLQGQDVLGILPTGVGKSLCYQLPSLLTHGTTLVVSPLISLMVDQVKQLKAKGYKSVIALNSFMDYRERTAALNQLNNYRLIYVSPEMLQNPKIEKVLHTLDVSLFVIDEAHCISQWGHEFRTDYLKMDQVIEKVGNPPVLALSATAAPDVQKDIKKQLGRTNMIDHIYPMDKPNISFAVEFHEHQDDKKARIRHMLAAQRLPTMIYFSSRQSAELVAEELNIALDQRVAFYHGGMEQMDRLLVQQQFMKDQLDVICCTSAFGMGVDKPNIRRVIHYHFPTQVESYIQEIGRAGRDGKPCASIVLYTPHDQLLPKMLMERELPEEAAIERLFAWLTNHSALLPDEEMHEQLQLSESQWNFLKYQLEETQVIFQNTIMFDVELWSKAKMQIRTNLRKRWNYKNEKFHQMRDWLYFTGCRRLKLYEPFQEGVRDAEVDCCDHCGFIIDDAQLMEEEAAGVITHNSWDVRLKRIFLQESINE
ncbi:RecQ family ATP-dependent DNA helicase [Halobacillus campisalis]|uniref:RecQ family ATP-dependent DNA helicase n=1 Tax=Halobacillus campisalis TaxID=435909 RepID=A0ABW2K1Z0_9BACI|nr:RecQ family ATP-dependent DNA helicase [Halobacillus campisalis]